jgi:protein subunit release factor A
MRLEDVRVDVFTAGASAVRVTHLPTGKTVTVEGASEFECRREAMRLLREQVETAP